MVVLSLLRLEALLVEWNELANRCKTLQKHPQKRAHSVLPQIAGIVYVSSSISRLTIELPTRGETCSIEDSCA